MGEAESVQIMMLNAFSHGQTEYTTRGVNRKLVITSEASEESMNPLLRLQSVLLKADYGNSEIISAIIWSYCILLFKGDRLFLLL